MRWIFRIVFGFLALALVAVAALFLLPAERIATLVTDRFEAATGRAMTLVGDVRPTLWPELGVSAGPVTIANAKWSEAGPMLVAERLSVGVDIAALFGGDIRVKRVEIAAPRLVLERGKDGRVNWDIARPGGAAAGAGGGGPSGRVPAFSLDRAEITGGTLLYIDRASGDRTELRGIDAVVRLPDVGGAAEIDVAAALHGQQLRAQGRIERFAAFLGADAVPVSVDIALGGNAIGFAGRAALDPAAAAGRLEADLGDMPSLFAALDRDAPEVPRGLGRVVTLSGEITATGAGALTLRNATIALDHNTLTGAADVRLGARPRLVAKLTAGALDLAGAVTGEGGGSGWSRAPIDVSALQALDAEVALEAGSIDFGRSQVGRTRLVTALEQGRAVTEIAEMAAYDGQVAGTVVVNSRGGLSTRANLQARGVRLRPLLSQLAGWDRLQTTGDVSVNLLGVGNSVDALMNSLSGEGEIRFGAGELAGLDLVGMLRHLDLSYVGEGAKTIFDSIGATFTVENGVVTNADLAVLAPLLTASGKGRIGLGGQTIDYRLEPKLLGGEAGNIRVPVLIGGTWADPTFRLDLEGLARERLDAEAEKVKVRAEEAVIERLNEELGVEIGAREEIDDVLKRELEERAAKGLLNLLGGRN